MVGVPLLLLLLTAAPGELQRAQKHYEALEFEACLQRLDRASRHHLAADLLARIELQRGLCLAGMDNRTEALQHFRLALELSPSLVLPPFTSPKVTQLFETAQAGIAPVPSSPPAPLNASAPPAETSAPPVVTLLPEKPPPPAPPAVPAWARYVSTGVAVGTTGLYAAWGLQARSQAMAANQAVYADEAANLGGQARSTARRANVALGAALLATGGAAFLWWLPRESPQDAAP